MLRAPLFLVLLFCLGSGSEAQEPQAAGREPSAARALTLDGVTVNEVSIVVGERGYILRSTDRGGTWTQVDSPVDVMLTAVTSLPGGRVWAVGHDAAILRSEDAGLTWTVQNYDPGLEAPLLDILFISDTLGFAVGAYDLFYETRDGGATWKQRPSIREDEPHLYQLARATDGTLYCAGEFGFIFRSEDSGETWSEIPSPYAGSFFGILALPTGGVLVYGLRGNAFRSDATASRWTKVSTETDAGLYGSLLDSRGRIWLGGEAGTVLVSTDAGRSFEQRGFPDRRVVSGFFETGETIDVVGEGGPAPLLPAGAPAAVDSER